MEQSQSHTSNKSIPARKLVRTASRRLIQAMMPTEVFLHQLAIWLKDKQVDISEDPLSLGDPNDERGDVEDKELGGQGEGVSREPGQEHTQEHASYEDARNCAAKEDQDHDLPSDKLDWRTEFDKIGFPVANPVVVQYPTPPATEASEILEREYSQNVPTLDRSSAIISTRSFHRYHVALFAYNINCRGDWAIHTLSVGSDQRGYLVTL